LLKTGLHEQIGAVHPDTLSQTCLRIRQSFYPKMVFIFQGVRIAKNIIESDKLTKQLAFGNVKTYKKHPFRQLSADYRQYSLPTKSLFTKKTYPQYRNLPEILFY